MLHTLLKNGFKPGERIVRKAIVVTPTRYSQLMHILNGNTLFGRL